MQAFQMLNITYVCAVPNFVKYNKALKNRRVEPPERPSVVRDMVIRDGDGFDGHGIDEEGYNRMGFNECDHPQAWIHRCTAAS
jgi:hypothetical protein